MLPSSNLEVRPEVDTKSTTNSIVGAGRTESVRMCILVETSSPARKIAPILISLLSAVQYLMGFISVEEGHAWPRWSVSPLLISVTKEADVWASL